MDVTVEDFGQLDRATLQSLLPLTNSVDRGDHRDGDPKRGGSGLLRVLEDHVRGFPHPGRAWAIIAREEGVPVAWCLVTEVTGDPDTGEAFAQPTCSMGLYVSPARRRQGLGTCLIQEARGLARKIGRAQLLASPWNAASKLFYQSHGFVEVRPYFTGWCAGASLLSVL